VDNDGLAVTLEAGTPTALKASRLVLAMLAGACCSGTRPGIRHRAASPATSPRTSTGHGEVLVGQYRRLPTPIARIVRTPRTARVYCGLQPIPRNAALLPDGRCIDYDSAWAEKVYTKRGDAFVFYLLGHEYRYGIPAAPGPSTTSSTISTGTPAD